jgi:ADP-heptose:LPS heptosyltransferase
METIIVKPSSSRQYREVVDFLKKKKVKTEIYKEPSKAQVLKSIEKGAKETAAFIKGKKELKEAKELLSEL